MSKVYNISRISNLLCYTIDDICNLYINRKLHPQTVRKWIKNGLVVIDNHKPSLIHGSNLKQFLGKLNDSKVLYYINKHKLYDLGLIFDNLLRTGDFTFSKNKMSILRKIKWTFLGDILRLKKYSKKLAKHPDFNFIKKTMKN